MGWSLDLIQPEIDKIFGSNPHNEQLYLNFNSNPDA